MPTWKLNLSHSMNDIGGGLNTTGGENLSERKKKVGGCEFREDLGRRVEGREEYVQNIC